MLFIESIPAWSVVQFHIITFVEVSTYKDWLCLFPGIAESESGG